jgi:hypothetical protein
MGIGVAVGGTGTAVGSAVGSGVAGAQAYSNIDSNSIAPTTLSQIAIGGPVFWFVLFMCVLLLFHRKYDTQR